MTYRLAVLPDFAEESWPSMNLCADMLMDNLPREAPQFALERFTPRFRWRISRIPGLRRRGHNADRFVNRLWDYPRQLRRTKQQFDLFHVVDHSYSQLLHELPAGRAGIFCHDLDTFRCLLEPRREPRPIWFRAMTRRILNGFQKAAVVFYSTEAVRRQITLHGIIDPKNLVQARNGVAPEFNPDPQSGDTSRLSDVDDRPYLLHVGSCIARKRIDVLLDTFACVVRHQPDLRLVQVGGQWTTAQREQIERLDIGKSIRQVQGLGRAALAAIYRRARMVLMTSEAEGFGLPVVEALACGAAVVASDIPVLREVGGDSVVYCPVGEIESWTSTVLACLKHPELFPTREVRLKRASLFSWSLQARTIADAYRTLIETGRPSRP